MSGTKNKIAAVSSHFAGLQTEILCPVCQQPLLLQENSFKCGAGHCYDLAAQNYLNLAPQKNQTANKYTTDLFKARRQVFAAGVYEPLLQKLGAICAGYQLANHSAALTILDAGCGEGYFAAELPKKIWVTSGVQVLGLDLAKTAVQLAAKTYRQSGLFFLIGDLAKLPLPDNSLDIILNLLSPANYQEFCRVLKPGGLLIKVIPGPDYLPEVRHYLHIPAKAAQEQQQAAKLWQRTFPGAQKMNLVYRREVTPELATAFLQMSPLSFNHDSNTEQNSPRQLFTEVTIDLQILTYNQSATTL